MKRLNTMKTLPKPGSALLAAAALALLAGPAAATEFWLCAKPTTLALPDGTSVPMWGYALSDANFADGCAGEAQIPGPTLEVTDGALTINLRNDLPAGNPTSIFIPGQALPTGSVATFVAGRVRSFGTEVAPGATGVYDWPSIEGNGTLIYHSGTHPQKQVYMGLSGLVTNDSAPGELYPDGPAVTYDNAVELFFSDIDPAFNEAVAAGTLTTAIERSPSWFLINGAPYVAGATPTADLPAGKLNENTLLRLASTATDTHVAVIQGLNMTIHAEDGQRYNWQNGDTLGGYSPRVQYSAMLPPAKTKDAIVVATEGGRYAVYDGNGYMTNPSDPAFEAQGDTVGGMLRFLSFTANQPPVAADDAYSTDEDVALNVAAPGVLTNDTDADGDTLTAAVVTGPASGDLTLNADGSFTYTPNADFNGADSFTYVANDGTDNSDPPATVAITVNPVNDAPVPAPDAYGTPEDTILDVNAATGVLANDTDVDGDTLNVVGNTQPANGSLVLNTDGSFTYTPNANYNGTDTFSYDVSDGTVTVTNTASVITVAAVNDPPVAADDTATTDEDTAVIIPVLANDTDADGDALTVTGTSTPANGSVVINADNTVTYTPGANFVGTDSFTYVANDGTADSNTATVTITVNGVNDAPVAVDDTVTTAEDTAVTGNVLANDSDPDGPAALTAALGTGPSNGALSLATDGSFTYTPNANFNGPDSFTYVANDGLLDSNVATVTITVTPVNDAPVAADDAYSVDQDTVLTVPAPGVLGNDSDVDGPTALTAVPGTGPANGSLTLAADGSLTYAPNTGFFGSDSFSYTASDGTDPSNQAVVTITVNPVVVPNTPPVAVNDTYSVNQDTTLTVIAPGVLGNDTDAETDGLSVFASTPPANGSLTMNADGSFDYTPTAGYSGPDSFTYVASDGTDPSNQAVVTITVNPVVVPNTPPVAVNDTYSVNQDTTLTVIAPGVLGNDTDAETDGLSVFASTPPANGSLTMNADGSFDYTPTAGYSGPDSFSYVATDGTDQSNQAVVTITVNAVTSPPVALYFSTLQGVSVPDVSGSFNNANIYAYNGAAYSRVLDFIATMGFNANVDALDLVDADTFYLSFSNASVDVPGVGSGAGRGCGALRRRHLESLLRWLGLRARHQQRSGHRCHLDRQRHPVLLHCRWRQRQSGRRGGSAL